MRFLILILVALFTINLSCKKGEIDKGVYSEAVISPQKFYYAFDEKIQLSTVNNKIVIRFDKVVDTAATEALLTGLISGKAKFGWYDTRTCLIAFYESSNIDMYLKDIFSLSNVIAMQPLYITTSGAEIAVTDEFVVKFKENVSQNKIDDINKKNDVILVKVRESHYIFGVKKGKDVLALANRYQESGLTVFSHPDFFTQFILH